MICARGGELTSGQFRPLSYSEEPGIEGGGPGGPIAIS